MTADDFRKAREFVDEAKLAAEEHGRQQQENEQDLIKKERESKRKAQQKVLSFAEEEEGAEEVFVPRKKQAKNPSVDTSFLPDRDRDSELERRRRELSAEWLQQQEVIKSEVSFESKLGGSFAIM